MKVHSKHSTELEAVTIPDQFALHVSRPGVSEMPREVHEEMGAPTQREQGRICLEYSYVSIPNYISIKGQV